MIIPCPLRISLGQRLRLTLGFRITSLGVFASLQLSAFGLLSKFFDFALKLLNALVVLVWLQPFSDYYVWSLLGLSA
jgi:hypothetical protein